MGKRVHGSSCSTFPYFQFIIPLGRGPLAQPPVGTPCPQLRSAVSRMHVAGRVPATVTGDGVDKEVEEKGAVSRLGGEQINQEADHP